MKALHLLFEKTNTPHFLVQQPFVVLKHAYVDQQMLAQALQEPSDMDGICPILEFFVLTASPAFCRLVQYAEVPPPSPLLEPWQYLTTEIGRTPWLQLRKSTSQSHAATCGRSTNPSLLVPTNFNPGKSDFHGPSILVHEKRVPPACRHDDAIFLCL